MWCLSCLQQNCNSVATEITLWQQGIRASQIQKAALKFPVQNTEEELAGF